MRVLDLFSGIGGFSLGLERAGMQTVAFCEIDPYCRQVLRKHWPNVKIYEDVRELSSQHLTADGIGVDLICGGFPCQDISLVGKGGGIDAERSGLWKEYARIIGEVGPRYVIVENVSALLIRGIDRVLGDLAALGYDAEWHCIPASAVGAPHRRDRIWIIANSDKPRLQRWDGSCLSKWNDPERYAASRDWWSTQPDICRVAHGVPSRVDRIKSLGNSLVPHIPEIIGRAIMSATHQET